MSEEKITQAVMEQYEAIRQSGATNMFDYYNVIRLARRYGLRQLASLTRPEYAYLLMNFQRLMKKYGVEQPEREDES